ncbi:hypothetical protein [Pseudomonas vancouverensis]|uniref:Uncharacterized protein n=1 Tax=Pseudomonas vancouverensis TaxID=95300 RepID=A0A1H2P5W5_PSEVA|nr:hypothetical protein [Pseudomonas vancouverensis]KAB0499883.1 hypothetical protein F7R09_01560 [Pseudomonas vancouverensis]TDB68372.1 hypothetical protein EIY72_00530 [Pseudomonas vancouverensis]SDV13072.1 hypothetical protein SAMN05216558_3755 [Pseudomonas vancouverensis]
MNITSNTASAALSAYTSSAEIKAAAEAKAQSANNSQATDKSKKEDALSLSKTAAAYSGSIASNAPFFPVRPGMNADALVLGVSQPDAVSSSKGKTFPEVATDARKRMDDKYAQMKTGDKPYSGSVEDRNALMGDLDRRSLNAVATNEGGQFSKDEQDAAKALMQQQARLASGYYSGPDEQKNNWKDPFANDPIGRAKAALNFLQKMTPEEKNTPQWLSQHMTLQNALDQYAKGSSSESADKKTGHFHNLAEILAGVETDGAASKNPQNEQIANAGNSMMDRIKALMPSPT